MLTQPLLDKLSKLHLSGFRAALEEQLHNPQYDDLSFEERLGLLVDIETTRRPNSSTCWPRAKSIPSSPIASPWPKPPAPTTCSNAANTPAGSYSSPAHTQLITNK